MSSSEIQGDRERAFPVFAVGTAVGLLHAADDALLHRQPGVPADQHLLALAVVTMLAAAAVWSFRRVGTGLRAGLALGVGAVMATNGAMHVIHASLVGISGSDVTGIVATGFAVVLLVMAALLPFLHRGERRLSRGRRWSVRVLATAAVGLVVTFVLMPIGVGIGQTHLYRSPIGDPPDRRFASVSFSSSDDLDLTGWYAPSQNGAAVLLVSSARGDRTATVDHATMLADHGYGVLLYDARGTGESEGSPNGYGWGWQGDVEGALDYLTQRPGVDPSRIGALGLSTGADVLIEVAAEDDRLAAVVSDGATIRSLADIPKGQRSSAFFMGPVLATARLTSGEEPGPPLVTLVERMSPTPLLLVAAGSIGPEITVNEMYAEAAGGSAELWALPEARHTAAIHDEAVEYERRVVAHFDQALLTEAN